VTQLDPAAGLLDNPVWHSIAQTHSGLAEHQPRAARYLPEVSPFAAVADADDPESWRDLAELVEPEGFVVLTGVAAVGEGWEIAGGGEGVQLVDTGVDAVPDPEVIRLGPADVPDMLDLVARTKPGPFAPRTVELGAYLGVRRDGVLVAMAGERLKPPGWTEISAVCTDASVRGQGLATRLVRAVAYEIRERGDTPMLHAAASNTNAIRLYEALGFSLRRMTTFYGVRRAAAS
jgi:ribosomal protein S18 acetylase RimI-like enzyme